MTVNIPEALRAYVEQKVATGQYASAEEVVETALLELQNIETGELDARWLKAKIEAARMSLDVDGGMTVEAFKQRMLRVRERRAERAKA